MSAEARAALRQSIFQRLKKKHAARLAYYQRTGKFPRAGCSDPWLPQEEKLLKKHSTRELIAILGRTWEGIQSHRRKLNIRLRPTNTPWSETELKLLGMDRDAAIAKRLHRSVAAVKTKRQNLRIRAFRPAPA